MDKSSLDLIQKLHPSLRDECLSICGLIKMPFVITSTLRMMSEQLKLYNQGRLTPGQIVTNAKPGQSYHNYGLALDVALLVNGKLIYDASPEIVEVFTAHGWTWGGSFKSIKDRPHFEKTPFHWRELWSRHVAGKLDKEGYVIL